MREIKFRGWQNGEMNYDPYIYGGCSGQEDFDINDCFKIDFPIMQFTGLHDKNGKDIYEGDILRYLANDKKNHLGIVEWFGVGGGFNMKNELGSWTQIAGIIIGNIYENPSLVK